MGISFECNLGFEIACTVGKDLVLHCISASASVPCWQHVQVDVQTDTWLVVPLLLSHFPCSSYSGHGRSNHQLNCRLKCKES